MAYSYKLRENTRILVGILESYNKSGLFERKVGIDRLYLFSPPFVNGVNNIPSKLYYKARYNFLK